jgi:hypothetical protein
MKKLIAISILILMMGASSVLRADGEAGDPGSMGLISDEVDAAPGKTAQPSHASSVKKEDLTPSTPPSDSAGKKEVKNVPVPIPFENVPDHMRAIVPPCFAGQGNAAFGASAGGDGLGGLGGLGMGGAGTGEMPGTAH